ncbi:MAG TPA: Nramp family divalent metal transporter [Ilumatobacteraceae bacterium]|nr:Nramp family divalent metal transporter [Ilumatobacteraceae bacterium]
MSRQTTRGHASTKVAAEPASSEPRRRDGEQGFGSYLRALGPGLVTGASDDDPSGIATYSQAGAQFKYSMAWVALVTLPLSAAVQEICDRTALATGKSLGELARAKFGRFGRAVMALLLIALLAANTANIAADLLAIGSGLHLLHLGPVWLGALIAGILISLMVMLGSFELISRIFRYLCLSLFAYIIVLAAAKVEWGDVLRHTFVPDVQLNSTYLGLLVAVLGTTLSPYLFFWQTAHRVEDMEAEPIGGDAAVPLDRRRPKRAAEKLRHARFDVFVGMGLSNIVMFAIIVATASTLGRDGQIEISSAAEAAKALEPIAGKLSSVLFAAGFIGTGILAVPVLAASASVGLAGLFRKPWGFSNEPRRAPTFYVLVGIGTLGGTIFSLVGINPIRLLVISAIVNGLAAAPFLIAIMLISGDSGIMGQRRNGRLATTLGWLTVALMVAAAAAMFISG